MSPPLLILVTGQPVPEAERRHGDFPNLIRRALDGAWTGRVLVQDLRQQPELPDPSELAAVIVTGSPAHLEQRADWMLRGIDAVRSFVATNTPTLGICFGHQMLGEALGGRVGRNPNGREIGTVPFVHHADNPLLDRDDPFTANVTHLDSIVELPPGSQVVAATEKEPHALVRFSDTAWGVQFHPEMDADVLQDYVLDRRDALLAEGFVVDDVLNGLGHSLASRRVLANFVRRIVLR